MSLGVFYMFENGFQFNLRNLRQNLTKQQKIGILIAAQVLFIVIIIVVVNLIFQPRSHVEIKNDNLISGVPASEQTYFKEQLWNIVSANYSNVDRSVIDDAVIRDGSVSSEFDEATQIHSTSFIVDIDSLELTYNVTIQWSTKEQLPDTVMINCPPMNDMKYPGTICRGMYDSTYSFDLYFPYYGDREFGGETYTAYEIDGDETTKTITITSSVCDPDKYNAEALEYLKQNTPFYNNPEYQIQYVVNTVDEVCE